MAVYSDPPIDWLLEAGDAWVRYRTRIDLLGQPETDHAVQEARSDMLNDPRTQSLIEHLQDWPGPPLSNHKQAGHHLHLLSFLAEIGLRESDPGLERVVERILKTQADEGAFQISVKLRKTYGGTDQPMLSWALCDAPLVLYSLCKLGVKDGVRITRAIEHLTSYIRDNGWPCAGAYTDSFRGPGRKTDPCPYATLLGLKALAACPEPVDHKVTETGVKSLLWHWDIQAERKVYLFGIGTDFRKPKLPLVWYDILHVVDVLSQYEAARIDPRYRAMLNELMSQADDGGRFTAVSMYRAWKEWAFADKRQPSPGVTFIAWRAAIR